MKDQYNFSSWISPKAPFILYKYLTWGSRAWKFTYFFSKSHFFWHLFSMLSWLFYFPFSSLWVLFQHMCAYKGIKTTSCGTKSIFHSQRNTIISLYSYRMSIKDLKFLCKIIPDQFHNLLKFWIIDTTNNSKLLVLLLLPE